MTTQPPHLVNKQFNSPIGLYSEQNVREVLEREQHMLANGAIGIDFHNPSVGKPANLQNSAVLRMLEEEENRRGGRAGYGDYGPRSLRDVSWPPPDYAVKSHLHSSFKDVVIPGVKRVAWPPPQEGILDPAEVVQQSAVQQQGGSYYTQSPGLPQNNYSPQQQAPYQQPPAQPSYRPLKPLDVSSVGTGSPLASPAHNQSPQGYHRSGPPASGKGWAPVHSPVTTHTGSQNYFGAPAQGYQTQPQYHPVAQPYQQYPSSQAPGQYQQTPPYQYQQQQYPQSGQQYQQPGPQYQQPSQQYNQPSSFAPQQYQSVPQQQYQAQPFVQSAPSPNQYSPQPPIAQAQVAAFRPQPAKPVEPPPSTITLRPSAPVSQVPAPVYSAQPATASLKGGKHLRGDLKWPPENVRQRMSEEEQHRLELAQGPACRPLRKDKDYTPFFEQHALNSTYPGYKIPPGTQFYRPE